MPQTQPRLSVIVTAYNIEHYIEQCLDSIAAQTVSDFEVLVVDDGSTDTTAERIVAYTKRDTRFVPVLLPDNTPGGVATAANTGLDRASGEWIGFVDGDDYVEPTMFERLITAAENHGADLAMCQYDEVDDAGPGRPPADHRRWQELGRDRYELDARTKRTFLPFIAVPWRKVYRRSLLEDNDLRFPVGDYFYEDNPFHWFVVLSADSIALVPEVLCHHRVARAGQTMGAVDGRLLRIFLHHDTIRGFLVERGLDDEFGTTLLAWAISQLEWISRRVPEDLQRELYDKVGAILRQYPLPAVSQALSDGRKGEYGQQLTFAIAQNRFAAYRRLLSGKPRTSNPVALGVHHLRASGPGATLRMTGRYVRNRLPEPAAATLTALTRSSSGDHDVTLRDVMTGLMVLQQQLARVEERLDQLESRLDEQ